MLLNHFQPHCFEDQDVLDAVDRDGFVTISDALSISQVQELRSTIKRAKAALTRRGAGLRNLLENEEIKRLACSQEVRSWATSILGSRSFAVRGLFFDKNSATNWKVPFHQDLSIAVRERIDTAGFGPWSLKAGVLHTQPPLSILENMLAIRIHLDDCFADNGALRVLRGTHKLGRLTSSQIKTYRQEIEETVCEVPTGSIVIMRPLLLHASSVAVLPKHRRVIHLEYAGRELPHGLQWRTSV
jgi:ectoine hydroxylase-related dioxygenase (phytanoyl-CoA dioxygenase family)